jgi:hypothetical protein
MCRWRHCRYARRLGRQPLETKHQRGPFFLNPMGTISTVSFRPEFCALFRTTPPKPTLCGAVPQAAPVPALNRASGWRYLPRGHIYAIRCGGAGAGVRQPGGAQRAVGHWDDCRRPSSPRRASCCTATAPRCSSSTTPQRYVRWYKSPCCGTLAHAAEDGRRVGRG